MVDQLSNSMIRTKDRTLVYVFACIKLIIHFLTNTNYALHRDEYLYFDQGQHLSWGYMEVPPFTAALALLADLMGGSVFAIRLFPALFGSLTILLAGWLVLSLKGKIWAVILCCGSLLLSPALLGSNTLFQPVSFNQFFWFLSAFLLVKAVQTSKVNYWYALGFSMGLGILTKYSIAFYGVGIVLALLLTDQRKWLKTRYPYVALGICLLVALPNMLWQWAHNIPLLTHMQELRETQLMHMDWGHFLGTQLEFHFSFSIIWLTGLIGLMMSKKLRDFKFVAIGLIVTILLIGFLQGKPYYTNGAFTILFPFGAVILEQVIKKTAVRFAVFASLVLISLITLPYALPVLSIDKMKAYCRWTDENLGNKNRWEDGNYYDLPQDYADMNGWEELAERVANVYHDLPDSVKSKCVIYGGSYGHAGALNYFSEKYALPEVYSFNGSYRMWLPNELEFETMIIVEEVPHHESTWFVHTEVVDSIRDENARDRGIIHFRKNPRGDLRSTWTSAVKEAKEPYNFR